MKNWLNRKKIKLSKYILMYRFWLLKKLFTEDEKYLIIRAIEDRIIILERIAINDRWADKDDLQIDCEDLLNLKKIFSTNYYK